jgi:hypothetical protein
MTEEEMWEQMVQELRERRTNRKKGVMTTAVRPTGSASVSAGVVSMDFASLYPNTMRMKISMKSILRKRSINKIYA